MDRLEEKWLCIGGGGGVLPIYTFRRPSLACPMEEGSCSSMAALALDLQIPTGPLSLVGRVASDRGRRQLFPVWQQPRDKQGAADSVGLYWSEAQVTIPPPRLKRMLFLGLLLPTCKFFESNRRDRQFFSPSALPHSFCSFFLPGQRFMSQTARSSGCRPLPTSLIAAAYKPPALFACLAGFYRSSCHYL